MIPHGFTGNDSSSALFCSGKIEIMSAQTTLFFLGLGCVQALWCCHALLPCTTVPSRSIRGILTTSLSPVEMEAPPFLGSLLSPLKSTTTALTDNDTESVTVASVLTKRQGVDEDTFSASSPFPGRDENHLFQCDKSVDFWKNFQRNGFHSSSSNGREFARVGSKFASYGADGIDFWLVSRRQLNMP